MLTRTGQSTLLNNSEEVIVVSEGDETVQTEDDTEIDENEVFQSWTEQSHTENTSGSSDGNSNSNTSRNINGSSDETSDETGDRNTTRNSRDSGDKDEDPGRDRESESSETNSSENMPTTGEIQNMMAGISFRDVEESLNKFRGQPFEDLDEWVAEYEDIAVTCNWTPTQKYLFARRLLDGPARKAVRANKTIKNYETSLAHLKEEHPNTASTSQIHDI